ncbi:unnamed protein product [Oppiella nova]|uniref:VWFA domain-containing protein n=1 Tax=Oppiella nova TaxID=334625 RepID=A0A7R9QI88_9ACAR|nr:unnamed protein product [Oppiella nova]CAG2166360.1 unnamed protein product [Oppiella nova]
MFLLILISITTHISDASKPINFVNGGYRGVVIAIHSDVKESDQLITNLEELLRKSSAFLYKATEGRARFVEFEVILPETWSKKDGYESIAGSHFLSSHIRIAPTDKVKSDEPYTYQPRGCGQPGEYIQLTDGFVNQLNGKTRDDFEYPEKHLIHEWAHYRYGVFDEYGIEGDSKYPSFYLENGTIYPTTCIKGIKGRQEDMDGNPCKIYSGGQVDSNCRFIPDKSDNSAVASIMFMPHIQSIEKFCLNNTNDTKLLHNNYAPNKHNIQCNYRSTAEVIEEHRDFKNQNPDTLSDGYSEPVIRLIRIDEDQSSRFVLVLDVSGSMRDFGRSALLHRAATRFVNHLIPDGMELGIIQFSTNATVLHPMITINETTRQSLAATIPKIPDGWTAIGKGLQLALEMLSEDEGGTRGATIILITDGEENQKEPTIEEIIPEVYKADIKVDSIAISTEADARLENISSNSGGKCFYMRDNDNATNTAMETAFMGFVSQQYIELILLGASEVGVWEVIIDKNYSYNRDIVVALTVTSDPKNPNNQPIRVNSYFGELEVRYPATALIYAEVMKGPNGIIGAKVLAIVERPDAEDVEVDLYDDGIGADITANDGIYTTAFTQFTQNGRNLSISPKSEFQITDFIATYGMPEDDIKSEPIHEFTRATETGAFKLKYFVPHIDNMPPGKVTDLQVITIDGNKHIVELQWTAPGDDAFTGKARKIDLRVSLTPKTFHKRELFEANKVIDESVLVAGSLEPREGHTIMRAKFQIPKILLRSVRRGRQVNESLKMSFYFSLRAIDDSNNIGEISNIASVHFGYVKPVLESIVIGTDSRPFETTVIQTHDSDGYVKPVLESIVIGTDSRPFETTVIQTHVLIPNPVLFYHNRILMQKLKNQTFIEIPKELGRNTTFTITSDDIRLLNITVTSPNGTVYSMTSDIVVYKPTEMKAQFNIRLATEGKWKVSFEKRQHETVIAYLSVTSESRVDEPIKVRAWMDTPFAGTGKPPTAVINAEVTKRYNYIICADVIAMVDRPKGQPIFIQLYDNGLGAVLSLTQK